jgi:predicted HAD superfamily Cof-like phosphohydrolase
VIVNVHLPFSTLNGLHNEVNQLRTQVTSLQEANTRLVEEKRRYDRQAMVAQFHRVFGQPVLHGPQVPPVDRVRLRLRLITEEFLELLDACRCPLGGDIRPDLAKCLEWAEPYPSDLPDVADALADLEYVISGSHCEFGIDGTAVFNVVHESNMAKAGPGSTRREDGKIQKPPGWKPPDIAGELERQQREASR